MFAAMEVGSQGDGLGEGTPSQGGPLALRGRLVALHHPHTFNLPGRKQERVSATNGGPMVLICAL